MIPLTLHVETDASAPFVTRLACAHTAGAAGHHESSCLSDSAVSSLWSGPAGLFALAHPGAALTGDVVLIDPARQRAERLIRAGSRHNTLLVTEQCDQLCIMCSQPPKKLHVDRFDLLREACLLAPPSATIGISGGEPTLHLDPLLDMVEGVLATREDLAFHILTNGQHFTPDHVVRLRQPGYQSVVWGIPLYAADPHVHDHIVGKPGAFARLHSSFADLLRAGARIELRTVLMRTTADQLPALAHHVTRALTHIEQWSLMGLEHIGFARARWEELHLDPAKRFVEVETAIDIATLRGVPVRLFNLPLCQIPAAYRDLATASISDWKQRFAPACADCSAKVDCSGFFEWHPDALVEKVTPL